MKRNLTIAGILFVLLAMLGGLATWDERKTKEEKADEKTKNRIVDSDLKPETIDEFDYYSKVAPPAAGEPPRPDDNPKDGITQLTAVKKNNVWRMTKPLDVAADSSTIDGIIKTVTEYTYAKEVSDKKTDWGNFGLVDPARTISIRYGGEVPRTVTVYIGDKAPIGYNVYLRTNLSDKVYIGSQHILVSSAKVLTDFRDKSIVKLDEPKLKTLTYQRFGEPEIEMTKTDSKYQIVRPEKLEADQAAIRDFAEQLSNVKATAFDDAPSPTVQAAFKVPQYAISWKGESGEASKLLIGIVGQSLVAAFDPTQRVFTIPDEEKAKLRKDLNDFRNRRMLEPELLDAKTVDIDGDVYKNVEGNWYTAADAAKLDDKGKPKDGAKPEEKSNIRTFLVDLEFAKSDKFLGPDAADAKSLNGTAPTHRIVLGYQDPARKPTTIELYKAPGADEKYLVRRSGSAVIYRVPVSAFNSMTPSKAPPAGVKEAPVPLDEESGGDAPVPGKNSGLNPPNPDKKAG